MTIMDRGAMAIVARKKVAAAGGCAHVDAFPLSQASRICTRKAGHGSGHKGHRFVPIVKVLLTDRTVTP